MSNPNKQRTFNIRCFNKATNMDVPIIRDTKHLEQPENRLGHSFDDLERRRSLPDSIKVCESQESWSAASVPFTQPLFSGRGTSGSPPPRKFEKSNSQQNFKRTCSVPTVLNKASRLSLGTKEYKEVYRDSEFSVIHSKLTFTYEKGEINCGLLATWQALMNEGRGTGAEK